MAKNLRDEQMPTHRQRRTILELVVTHGYDAVMERFGMTMIEAQGAVRAARDWERANRRSIRRIDWHAEFEAFRVLG